MEAVPDPYKDAKRKRYIVRPPTMPSGIGIKLAHSGSKLKEKVGTRLSRQDSSSKYNNAAEGTNSERQAGCDAIVDEPLQFEDATDDESAVAVSEDENASIVSIVEGTDFYGDSPLVVSEIIPRIEIETQESSSPLSTQPIVQKKESVSRPAMSQGLESTESHETTGVSSRNESGNDEKARSGKVSLTADPLAHERDIAARVSASAGNSHNSDNVSGDSTVDESHGNNLIRWSGSVTDLMQSLEENDRESENAARSRSIADRAEPIILKFASFVRSIFEFALFCVMLPLRAYLRGVGIRARVWNQKGQITDNFSQSSGGHDVLAKKLAVPDPIVPENLAPSRIIEENCPADFKFPPAAQIGKVEDRASNVSSGIRASNVSTDIREGRDGKDHPTQKLSEFSSELKRGLKKTLSKGLLTRKGSMSGQKKVTKSVKDEELLVLDSSPTSVHSEPTCAFTEEEQSETPPSSKSAIELSNDGRREFGDFLVCEKPAEIIVESVENSENSQHVIETPLNPNVSAGTRQMLNSESRNLNADENSNLYAEESYRTNDGIRNIECDISRRNVSESASLSDSTSIRNDPAALIPARSAAREDYNEYFTTEDDGKGHKELILDAEFVALHRKNSAGVPSTAQVNDTLSHVKNAPKALLRSLGGLRRTGEDTRFASARSARKTALLLTDILTSEMGAVCSKRRGALRLLATKDFDVTSRISTKINIDPLDDYSCNVTFLRERGDKITSDAFLAFVNDAHRRFNSHTTQGKPTVF